MALMVTVELEGVEEQEDDVASFSATGVAGANDILVRDLLLVTPQQTWKQDDQRIKSDANLQATRQASSTTYELANSSTLKFGRFTYAIGA